VASRGRGANRPAGRSGPRPPVIGPGAGSRCGSGPTTGSRIRGSASENRHGGAPRGFPVAPGQGGRASQARPKLRVRLSALHPPLIGGTELLLSRRPPAPKPPWARRRKRSESKMRRRPQTRAKQRAAGTKKTALFDIVNRADGQRFALRALRSHTPCTIAHAGALVSWASDPGLDPGERRPGTQELHGKINGH